MMVVPLVLARAMIVAGSTSSTFQAWRRLVAVEEGIDNSVPLMASNKAACDLWVKTKKEDWVVALDKYDACIQVIAEGKKKPTLIELDKWWRHELPVVLRQRATKEEGAYLTLAELVMVMEWKLSRGKFRPLLPKVQSNPADKVKTVTTAALRKATSDANIKEAIACLSDGLYGVGPATASAILAAYRGDLAPFMADEALAAVPALGPIKYTINQYTQFRDELARKGAEVSLPAELVGRALWCATIASAYGIDGSPGHGGGGGGESSRSGSAGSDDKKGKSGASDEKKRKSGKRNQESTVAGSSPPKRARRDRSSGTS